MFQKSTEQTILNRFSSTNLVHVHEVFIPHFSSPGVDVLERLGLWNG